MSLGDPLTFATGAGELDRAAHLRGRAGELLAGPSACLLPQWNEKPLIRTGATRPSLGWVAPAREFVAGAAEPPVFLGRFRGRDCFTADFPSPAEDGAPERFGAGLEFIDLRPVAGELETAEAAVAATAKGVIGWHRIHPFCARCGQPSLPAEGGWQRSCGACRAQHFPRTDPVVIMLVTRGDRVLLGRQQSWPPGLYSLLAGFMEPGETIADAVRRETFEETSVRVGGVGFLAAQPWPFPASLMLGCWAEALSEEIVIDAEIEDARWVSRDEVVLALDGRHPYFASPRRDAIARWMLAAWVEGEVGERMPAPGGTAAAGA